MMLNEHYQSDVKYVTEQNHFMLCMLGIWPSTDRHPRVIEKVASVILVIVCYFLLHCDLVPGVLYYIFVDDDPRIKVRMAPPILYSAMAIAKYSNLVIHECDIRNCLRHIKKDWEMIITDSARDVMMDKAITSRRMFTICFTLMYSSGVSYNIIVPLSRGKIITDENITIRALSCPGYYIFFDPQNSPFYEIVFLLQFLCGLVMYTITVTICGLAALFALHACAQMEILMQLMKNLVADCETDFGRRNVGAKLAIVIEHQIRIRNFLRLVENTLRYSSLVEIMGCTTIICLVGYCIMEEWANKSMTAICSYAVALMSVTINIFILCYIGEYITMQAEEVNLTSCTLDWYRLPTSTARDMILVTAMSNVPPKITAGNFINLSFKTFGDVIKSAVVYFNLLRRVTE